MQYFAAYTALTTERFPIRSTTFSHNFKKTLPLCRFVLYPALLDNITQAKESSTNHYLESLADNSELVGRIIVSTIYRSHYHGTRSHIDIGNYVDDIASDGMTRLVSVLATKKRARLSPLAIVRIEARRAAYKALLAHYNANKKEHTKEQLDWIEASELASELASEQVSEQASEQVSELVERASELERAVIGIALALGTTNARVLASELGCSTRTIFRAFHSIREKA